MIHRFLKGLLWATILNFSLLVFLFIVFYLKRENTKGVYEELQDNDVIYVYDTCGGQLNPSPFYTHISDSNDILKYNCESLYLGKESNVNFSPIGKLAFVLGYHCIDSAVIEVAFIDTICWCSAYGFVSHKTAFVMPPQDSLVIQLKDHLKNSNSFTNRRKKQKPSPIYGFWCGCM